jgi:hypothetical protein
MADSWPPLNSGELTGVIGVSIEQADLVLAAQGTP